MEERGREGGEKHGRPTENKKLRGNQPNSDGRSVGPVSPRGKRFRLSLSLSLPENFFLHEEEEEINSSGCLAGCYLVPPALLIFPPSLFLSFTPTEVTNTGRKGVCNKIGGGRSGCSSQISPVGSSEHKVGREST